MDSIDPSLKAWVALVVISALLITEADSQQQSNTEGIVFCISFCMSCFLFLGHVNHI